MAVPTITLPLSPDTGPTGGFVLVELLGTNFRLPTTPPATGPTSRKIIPSVEVEVGGRLATNVAVVSSTRLFFTAPEGDDGAQDVTVRNIDDAGVLIPGEEVTEAGAFTFSRPDLTVESDLVRLIRTLIQTLKRQVIAEVLLTASTDWAAVGTAIVNIGKLPAIVLVGPDLPENRFYSQQEPDEEEAIPDTLYIRRRTPQTVDLNFTLLGLNNATIPLINLEAVVSKFFQLNPYLYMDRDASNVSKGQVRYEMDTAIDAGVNGFAGTNLSDVRSFSMPFVIRGFDLEATAGFPTSEEIARSGVIADDGILVDFQDIPTP